MIKEIGKFTVEYDEQGVTVRIGHTILIDGSLLFNDGFLTLNNYNSIKILNTKEVTINFNMNEHQVKKGQWWKCLLCDDFKIGLHGSRQHHLHSKHKFTWKQAASQVKYQFIKVFS